MPVNVLGTSFDIAAGAVGVENELLRSNQYNPVPWLTQALFCARVRDPNTPLNPAEAAFNLNIRGDQIARGLQIPDGQLAVIYSQLVRQEIQPGQVWQATFDNPGSVVVRVQVEIYFYHQDDDGTWDQMPDFQV